MTQTKNLAKNALGTLSATGMAIASTGPAYSLAVTVGILAAAVGTRAPLALGIAIIPMIFVALSFRELNRLEPDCGTNYTWTKSAFGKTAGWMTGWVSVMACVLVMSNLAQVAATFAYTVLGFDGLAESKVAQALLGVALMAVVTALAYCGIRLAARVQLALVAAELGALAYFVVQALNAPALRTPAVHGTSASVQPHEWGMAFLAAVFLYWGWDTAFSVNEESDEPSTTPGRAALLGNLVLLIAYVLVAWTAVRYAGVEKLAGVADDDFFGALAGQLLGSTGGKILGIAVFFSAMASAESTVIPTARTLLAMGHAGSLPARFAHVSPKLHTPTFATVVFGIASTALYFVLVLTSESVLTDSVAATAVLIAAYYTITAAAVPVVFKAEAWTLRNVMLRAVVPALAVVSFVWLFVLAFADLSHTSLVVVALVVISGLCIRAIDRPAGNRPSLRRVQMPQVANS